jgi:gamma-glutamylcyclotransferase (GGCT)/AIG2-like uncharacterized protein YtfP
MKTERMIDRISSARVIGRAFLSNKRLVFNKKSKDGSGKANIEDSRGDVVWGVLYEIDSSQLSQLDRIEGGYNRVSVNVIMDNDEDVIAEVYVSNRYTDNPIPFDWYKKLMLQGAIEHGLPSEYIEYLKGIHSR